jgi:hypothetical protein
VKFGSTGSNFDLADHVIQKAIGAAVERVRVGVGAPELEAEVAEFFAAE